MKIRLKTSSLIQGFIIIHLLWFIAALLMNSRILPSPIPVYSKLFHFHSNVIWMHIGASLYRIISGIGISLLLGASIGILMAYSKAWNRILGPLVYFTYPIPKTVLLPVLMLIFGLGDGSKIILIIMILIFQVIVVVRDAVNGISNETYALIHSLGASKFEIFIHVTIPGILPDLLTNLRLSIGTALSILFFTEAYGTGYGIGYYILDSWTRIDYISMYLGIVVISYLGFILFIGIDLLEEFLCKWQRENSHGGF